MSEGKYTGLSGYPWERDYKLGREKVSDLYLEVHYMLEVHSTRKPNGEVLKFCHRGGQSLHISLHKTLLSQFCMKSIVTFWGLTQSCRNSVSGHDFKEMFCTPPLPTGVTEEMVTFSHGGWGAACFEGSLVFLCLFSSFFVYCLLCLNPGSFITDVIWDFGVFPPGVALRWSS